jgi:hypothetical protein
MQNGLQKLIRLSKKTGDRLIVFDDNNSEDSFVLMGVNDYEKLVIHKSEVRGLTEDELLDKINRDIAIWKSEDDYTENELKNNNFDKTNGLYSDENDINEEDDMYYYEEEEKDDKYQFVEEIKKTEKVEDIQDYSEKNNPWRIPKRVEKEAEEIL